MAIVYPILPASVQIKPIPGHIGYFASSDGRIWSQYRTGDTKLHDELRELKATPARRGHLRVGLRRPKPCLKFVHRLVLETFVGPCPEGMEGCHDPDPTPSNCNLSNLRWDTRRNNHHDMLRAGRGIHGIKNGRAKLTEDDVKEIFRLHASGVSQRELGRKFDITRVSIRHILMRKIWKHIDGPPPIASRPPLTELQAATIIQLARSGMNQYDIAERFNTTQSNVSLIFLGKSWPSLHKDDRWKSVLIEEGSGVPLPF